MSARLISLPCACNRRGHCVTPGDGALAVRTGGRTITLRGCPRCERRAHEWPINPNRKKVQPC